MYNFISTSLSLRIKNGCGFRNVCSKKWQEIPRNVMFRELEKTEGNLRGPDKLMGSCERRFKVWVDHSIKNIFLREAANRAKTKSLKKQQKMTNKNSYKENIGRIKI